MRANYNMTGKERKALVDAIAAITGEAAEYSSYRPALTRSETSRSIRKAQSSARMKRSLVG
jgi:hypothetical protein